MENNVNIYIDALINAFIEMARVVKTSGSIIYNLGDKIDKRKGAMLIPYRFAINALDAIPDLSLLNDITWIKKNPTPRQFNRRLVSATEPFFHFIKSNEYFYDANGYMAEDTPAPKYHKPTGKLGLKYFEIIKDSNLTPKEKQNARDALKKVIDEVNRGEIMSFRMKVRGHHAPAFGGQNGGRKIQMEKNGFTIIKLKGTPIKKDYILSAVESTKNIEHPAVFPLYLIEEFIKLSCPNDGIVLDPYCGSGTSLVAARKLGRRYIGIDINLEYCNICQERLNDV